MSAVSTCSLLRSAYKYHITEAEIVCTYIDRGLLHAQFRCICMVVTASSHGVCSMWQQLCISGSSKNSSLCMRCDNVIARFYMEDNIFTLILRFLVPQVNHTPKVV